MAHQDSQDQEHRCVGDFGFFVNLPEDAAEQESKEDKKHHKRAAVMLVRMGLLQLEDGAVVMLSYFHGC